jgi:hypothetical protein
MTDSEDDIAIMKLKIKRYNAVLLQMAAARTGSEVMRLQSELQLIDIEWNELREKMETKGAYGES